MCPKGDDPLTTNQEYRKIRMHVKGSGVDLSGQLGFRFHGKTIFFPLEYYYSNVTCNDKFAFLGKFAHVGCSQVTVNNQHFYYEMVFYSWPVYPKDNNLYSHDGNPPITDFFCDTTYASRGTYCEFEDIAAINVRGRIDNCILMVLSLLIEHCFLQNMPIVRIVAHVLL